MARSPSACYCRGSCFREAEARLKSGKRERDADRSVGWREVADAEAQTRRVRSCYLRIALIVIASENRIRSPFYIL